MNIKFLLIAFPLVLFASSVQDQMKTDLDIIGNFLEIQYAPLKWKEKQGWRLKEEIAKAKSQVDQKKSISQHDFHAILHNFFKSLHDYHTTVQFLDRAVANLPFTIRGAENRYFISYVEKELEYLYPLEVGDELLSVNGRPVHEVIWDLQLEQYGTVGEGTDRSLAEIFFTHRSGFIGHEFPAGMVMIQFKPKSQSKLATYQFEWSTEEEHVSHPDQNWQKLLLSPLLGSLNRDAYTSFVPLLGSKIWESQLAHAYLFQKDNGKMIGYLRLADFQGGKEEIQVFEEILTFFESKADALVIDQVNNPGGSLFFMMAFASMLGQPLVLPAECVSISQEELAVAKHLIPLLKLVATDEDAKKLLGEELSGFPMTEKFARSLLTYYQLIIDTYQKNKNVTAPACLYGMDYIEPHPSVAYTKPILLLVNELSFSCGDLFPAILQDNHRAVIMGMPTAGAGGYVLQATFPNRFGIAGYTYTSSVIERVDRKPLENLGVIPDIVYKVTAQDLQNDYQDYKKAVLKALDTL